MTNQLIPNGDNNRKIHNLIPPRRPNRHIHQPPRNQEHDSIHPLEVLDDLIHADEEARLLELLRRRHPFDVDGEEVAQDGFRQVDGHAAEEDHEEGHPLDGGVEVGEEVLAVETVEQVVVC